MLIGPVPFSASVQSLLHDHLPTTLARPYRRQQLIEMIVETDRLVVGHHALLLDTQDRFKEAKAGKRKRDRSK